MKVTDYHLGQVFCFVSLISVQHNIVMVGFSHGRSQMIGKWGCKTVGPRGPGLISLWPCTQMKKGVGSRDVFLLLVLVNVHTLHTYHTLTEYILR